MSNYSTLQQNTLLGFSETAGCLYLNLLDKYQGWNTNDGERMAFLEAHRYENSVGETLDYILDGAPMWSLDPSTKKSLSGFFADRWRHNFMEQER